MTSSKIMQKTYPIYLSVVKRTTLKQDFTNDNNVIKNLVQYSFANVMLPESKRLCNVTDRHNCANTRYKRLQPVGRWDQITLKY